MDARLCKVDKELLKRGNQVNENTSNKSRVYLKTL